MKSFTVTSLACLSINAGLALAGPVNLGTSQSKRNNEHVARAVPVGSTIYRCASPGQVALTFDDGPWLYTSQMLDLLDSYGVKGTFFLNGNGRGQDGFSDPSQPWGDLLKRMNSGGHQLASHTWSHAHLNDVDDATRRSEMSNNEKAFTDLLGFYPTYMRPPYLECSGACLSLMAELGYHVIDTNLDTKDYENDSPDLIQISKDRFAAGLSTDSGSNDYIVLSHDVHYETVASLTDYMINLSRERGYKLVTVGECLGDPSGNWYRTSGGSTGGGSGDTPSTPVPEPSAVPSSNPEPKTITTIVKTEPTTSPKPPTSGLEISPNARCGDDTGYTCIGSAYGDCCGFYGFCGSTETYCGAGCREGPEGTCWSANGGKPGGTDMSETGSGSGSGSKESTDGRCGSGFGTTCSGYGSDYCCSSYGYCGTSSEHCGSGCQSGFGTCN